MLAQPEELLSEHGAVVFDCRFSLADPAAGRTLYEQGHVPGAFHLDLERDLSGPVGEHGGRHPLPGPDAFAARLAAFGVDRDTPVIVYDDNRFAFSSRLWWLMRSLGYRPPRLLDGGYQAFLAVGGRPQAEKPPAVACDPPRGLVFNGYCDIEGLRRAQSKGALLVDAREAKRYEGLEEPIDPVAGHIPGAINRPWQRMTDETGRARPIDEQLALWGDILEAEQLVVYCGSGVTACVNLFSLALLGREDGSLYAGSWSDWCSYL
jgi:thiosulfate/3-mercaptopyruvate sulfurtransferase